jgi:predicted amidophosphoribosyltransferase
LTLANQCPVCQARFRGVTTCSRCGADLRRLMLLAAHAWRLRESARAAIASGDFERSLQLASEAQQVQATRQGEALLKVGEWLTIPI